MSEKLNVLIVGLNWIGDCIMAMPAIQLLRNELPHSKLTILSRSGTADLWRMHPVIDDVLEYDKSNAALLSTARMIKAGNFDCCYVLPNSTRSALMPALAGIPQRIGHPGRFRSLLLTDIIARPEEQQQHQAVEVRQLLQLTDHQTPNPPPELAIPPEALQAARQHLSKLPGSLVAMMPGAARGPSKQWPAEYYGELGRMLSEHQQCSIVFFGAASERTLCDQIAAVIPGPKINLAGKTSLPEWAAALSICTLTICNDSGGMHLAAASACPLIALYGTTDPSKTGPLSRDFSIIQKSEVRSRAIARNSELSREKLALIKPEEVFGKVCDRLHDMQTTTSAAPRKETDNHAT